LENRTTVLTDEDVEIIIAGWQAFKPAEPSTCQPLFVWPDRIGLLYIVRIYRYIVKMKLSGWDRFHIEYQNWLNGVSTHYNLIVDECTEDNRLMNPQLMQLWNYQIQAQVLNRENTMSQSAWVRHKRARKSHA